MAEISDENGNAFTSICVIIIPFANNSLPPLTFVYDQSTH